jgi:hypothetical protein
MKYTLKMFLDQGFALNQVERLYAQNAISKNLYLSYFKIILANKRQVRVGSK